MKLQQHNIYQKYRRLKNTFVGFEIALIVFGGWLIILTILLWDVIVHKIIN